MLKTVKVRNNRDNTIRFVVTDFSCKESRTLRKIFSDWITNIKKKNASKRKACEIYSDQPDISG